MATSNLKGTNDSSDGDSQEKPNNSGSFQNDSTLHINGAANAKTGGQVIGGVVVQSGNRMQAGNQKETESPEGV